MTLGNGGPAADTSDTTGTNDRHARRRLILITAAVVIVVVGGFAWFRMSRENDPVAGAVSLLQQESKFDASREAVENFATVYEHLVSATKQFPKDCAVDAGKARCLALNQAASWSLNFATASGDCTQPAIQEGRIAMLDYVTKASTMADAAVEPPPLPPIPTC